jgi:hypothetical protein
MRAKISLVLLSWTKGRTEGEAQVLLNLPGEASLAAHQAAEP